MATIATPILPLYFYRYRSFGASSEFFSREMGTITKPYLWCADFNSLNDPMEGFYRPNKRITNYDRVIENIYRGKVSIGIASLSVTNQNELMWTHYAGNYSGFCIEYYADRLVRALPPDVIVARMGYDDEPPRIDEKDVYDSKVAALKILSQKKFNWAYEREWRLLGPIGKAPISGNDVIRSLYLGSRITDNNKEVLLELLSERKDVNIFEMSVDGYRHDWKAIQGPDSKKETAVSNPPVRSQKSAKRRKMTSRSRRR